MRLGYLRKKKFLDECKEVQDRPKITSHPLHDQPSVPIHLRKTPQKTYDESISKYRENNPSPTPDPFNECTFKPELSKTAGKLKQGRNVDDLLQWNEDKRFKLENQRLNHDHLNEDFTFQPKIDKKSEQMLKDRKGSVDNRLFNKSKLKQDKLAQLKQDVEKGWFQPQINQESIRLLKEKGQDYVKQDNGKTQNIDFWETVVRGSKKSENLLGIKDSESAKKWLEGRKQSKELTGNRHITGCEENFRDRSDNFVHRGRSKSKEIVQEYISPYNKSMLGSGLPLKTLISGSKAAFEDDKKKAKRSSKKERSKSRKLA